MIFKNQTENRKLKKLEYLAEIASLYYEYNLTQTQIAEKLFIDRSRVSRLINLAHKKGVVKIQINHYCERSYELESILKRTFDLTEAIVLNNLDNDYQTSKKQIGALAASYLEDTIRDGQTIGISWGPSISTTIDALNEKYYKNALVVQLVGGTSIPDSAFDISGVTQRLMNKIHAKAIYLNAPLFTNDIKLTESLKNQPMIAYALDHARHADLIITTIGDTGSQNFASFYPHVDDQFDLQELKKAGAVGFICAQAFDVNGKSIDSNFNRKVIGISPDDLKANKMVIVIAEGEVRAQALLAALNGGYPKVLITDQKCVSKMLQLMHK